MAEQTKNPKNSENLLFKRLTRLLSGPLVNYRTQTGRRLRRIDLDNFASRFKSASGKQFKKMAYDPFSNLQTNVMQGMQRTERYVDFDQMEYTPEIASALDIYADEMTTSSNLNPLMNIHCPNEEIKSILHTLYYDIMNVEFNLFGWSRTMCKYGDFFLYLDMDEDRGIQNVIGLPSTELERLEGEDKTNPNYVQFQWNSAGMTFENWQVAHFRVLGNDKYSPYGSSVLEPARRIWRQLTLLEDAMMAYRIVRSPERRVFYIEVGNIPPQDVEQYMQKIMTQMKRHQVVDPDTGRVDLRYNPLSIDEDYFIPTRAGQNSRVESLPGGQYTGDIDDVKYLRDKLFAALKVPQSYLSRGEGSEEDKTTLAQKDIRFARTIQRLQRSIVSELEKIGIIHLYILGFREDDLVSFKLSLNNPSKIAELQELEHWKTKFDTASSATEGFFSRRWISKNLFNMSDDEFLRNQREMFFDRQYDASLESVAEQVQADMSPDAAAGGTGTGDMEAELTADVPVDEPPVETEPADTGGDAEMGDLLATPGKRDDTPRKSSFADGSTTTNKSKGKKYTPVKNKSKSGYKVQNTHGLYNREKARSTNRNLFPGLSDFNSLARGIFEEEETNYSEEEKNIFSLNNEVKKIVESINFEDIKK
tara:strand:- start:6869 stop:8809 length:1941 start_codon:yes stop_codon:yes gene_type:complete